MSGSGIWSWTDGSVWNYENWSDGEPSGYQGERGLVQRKDGKWNDVYDKINEANYLCQYTL